MERGDNGERRFEALGFGRHYDNMQWVCQNDIILPSIGGAGSSLIGNVLLELDLGYVDLTKDILRPDGSIERATDPITRRVRAVSDRRSSSYDVNTDCRYQRHFMKTHLPAEEFADCAYGGVWLLVRDPRDALYSWHRYHLAFAEAAWEKVGASFEEFLQQPFFMGQIPVRDWVTFNSGWLQMARQSNQAAILKFEDLKRDPFKVMSDAFHAVNIDIDNEKLLRAIEGSSYDMMRAHEETVAKSDRNMPQARVMRSGKVDQWREWMTPRLASYFSDDDLRSTAWQFGYEV